MNHQSQERLIEEQVSVFIKKMRNAFLGTSSSSLPVNGFHDLTRKFSDISSLVRTLRNHDDSRMLTILQENLKENHVNFHVLSDVEHLLTEMLNGVSEVGQDQTGIIMMERLGLPWERLLIQSLKREFPSISIQEQSSNFNDFKVIKESSRDALMSITSADLIVAETGSIIMIDRNRLRAVMTTAPRHHVVIVPITKIIFSFDDATGLIGKTLRLRAGSIDAHVHVISNPSRTGDIEKIIVYGAHGPLTLDVYLLDVEGKTILDLLEDDELSTLMRYSGLVEFIITQMFPWLGEVFQSLEIPSLDVVAVSWFIEHFDAQDILNHFLFLKFIEYFLSRNGFGERTDFIQRILGIHGRIVSKILEKHEVCPQLVLRIAENPLKSLVNEVAFIQ